MPLEGSAEVAAADRAANTADQHAQNTSDGDGQNTGASAMPNAGTDNAQNNQAQPEKTFTQADVDRMIANRVKSGVKAELKKLTGETGGTVTVESLQQQLNEERTARQQLEARQSVRTQLADPKLNVPSANHAAIEELVHGRLEYGTDGKPTNLKEAIDAVKALAPTLFVNAPAHVNAGEGRRHTAGPVNMNDFIRRAAGHGN